MPASGAPRRPGRLLLWIASEADPLCTTLHTTQHTHRTTLHPPHTPLCRVHVWRFHHPSHLISSELALASHFGLILPQCIGLDC